MEIKSRIAIGFLALVVSCSPVLAQGQQGQTPPPPQQGQQGPSNGQGGDVATCGREGQWAREDKVVRWVPADQADRWAGRASAADQWAVEVLAEEE